MKFAVNIAVAIIVILLFSLLTQGKPAGAASTLEAEQIRLQAIVDGSDDVKVIVKQLRAESEIGKLLADYLVLIQTFFDDPEFKLPEDTPDDTIPNYLILRTISVFISGGSKKTQKTYLIKLHNLNKNNNLFEEDNLFINAVEFNVRLSEQRDFWRGAHIVKNLRYLSLYDKEIHNQYFRWLNASKGWVIKRETLYWLEKLGRDDCGNKLHQYNCVSRLMSEVTALPHKSKESELRKLLCNVTILRSREAIKITWCE